MKNKDELKEILTRLHRGTHDSTPTRRYHLDNPQAMEVDEWWERYYNSNDRSLRALAKEALNLLEEDV